VPTANIRVSPAAESQFEFHVLAVDFELRLYQDQVEVFSVGRNQTPASHPLFRGAQYYVRYNNNNGGPGALHVRVLETGSQSTAREVRYELNIGTVSSPQVIDLQFSLRTDPNLAAPA
jgi:hypothetical protein